MQDEQERIVLLRNPKSRDSTKYIDAEIWFGDIDPDTEEPIEGKGRWLPHTTVPGDGKYERLLNGDLGEIEIIAPPRNVRSKFDEVMSQGMLWNGERLRVNDPNERDRLLGAATRVNINNTLPKGKPKFRYTKADGDFIEIHKNDLVEVALAVQDFIEDCQDNMARLLSDTTLDINSGWPE